ncbi:M4 family metallopeptidase [Ornithinimicrobium sp. F0845]|uniref:M4 family metallopeptidase n=1 Tax=Ornithinimicrobium sp. F0845 TaxID=2926412 RepID=UPI001FF2D16D|nr:M4 family metallopeptidase [Ornithinimicrobium sp. F0845]MCK0113855.1 M4 family metallopeptidase [Ornithinimicrobium sp. F0845]
MRSTARKRRGVGGASLAVAAVSGLILSALPAANATPEDLPAAPGVAVTGDRTDNAETDTPSMVTGLQATTEPGQSAAQAARGFLAAQQGRFHIDNPARTLTEVATHRTPGQEVVRFQQQYQGVDVLGAQYVVRMETTQDARTVTGTSGKYFTDLSLESVQPSVSEEVAVERAVAAVGTQFGPAPLRRDALTDAADTPLTGTAQGLTILPRGDGVLTRHVTVTGVNSADGTPVRQEVYVDAQAGFPVLSYSSIKSFASADQATARGAAATSGAAATATPTSTQLVTEGTGVRYNGSEVPLNLYQAANGSYQMYDYGFRDDATPFVGTLLGTWDARGVDATHAAGGWPSSVKIFASDSTHLEGEFTESGAVDAHWAAHQVYDYYRTHFGRKGLDDKDGFINSLVGVTANGGPYLNAFWDGTKMVYGQGAGEYRTFSADTDVVGHEMTHGVIQHSANLVYAGQPGAVSEAIADYFGNAIDLEAEGMSMSDPDAGLLGEDLCRTLSPRECALRDLDNDLTTYDDLIGTTFAGDNGGVHLNSPIFSGALWDIRHGLGGERADQIVYRALTAYMTPLDGFTDSRAAVIGAAEELGATSAELRTISDSFADHGIVPGWETELGVDTTTLLPYLNIAGTGVGAGGGHYAVSRSNADGSEPYSIWVGDTDGRTEPRLMSPNNGSFNVYADTDGESVVWAEYTGTVIDFWSRPLGRGVATPIVFSHNGPTSSLAVDGDLVVKTVTDYTTGVQHVAYTNTRTGAKGLVDTGTPAVITALPSVKDGRIAYAKMWAASDGYKLGVEVFDTEAGTKTLMPIDPDGVMAIGQTALTSDAVYWIEDNDDTDQRKAAVRGARLDGTGLRELSAETGPAALAAYSLTASEDAVTVTSIAPATDYANETLPKLYQLSIDGKSKRNPSPLRMSCNRGEQIFAAADEGKRVLWLDGTTGETHLVVQDRPKRHC